MRTAWLALVTLPCFAAACASGTRAAPAPVLANRTAPVSEPARSPVCRDGKTIDAGTNDVRGDIDRNLVRRVIQQRNGELRRCYDEYLTRGMLEGRLSATFTIVGDGTVGRAEVTGFDSGLATCVCEVIATAKFLASERGPITIHYPIVFRASS